MQFNSAYATQSKSTAKMQQYEFHLFHYFHMSERASVSIVTHGWSKLYYWRIWPEVATCCALEGQRPHWRKVEFGRRTSRWKSPWTFGSSFFCWPHLAEQLFQPCWFAISDFSFSYQSMISWISLLAASLIPTEAGFGPPSHPPA